MEFLGKSVQFIEIAEKVECYDVKLPGNISYCIEGGSWHQELGILRSLGFMFSIVFVKLC